MTDTNKLTASETEYKRDEKNCVIRAQPETHVYLNPYGEIVIRQANWPEEDMWVSFAPDHLPNVVQRICEWAGEDMRLALVERLTSFVLREPEADCSANDQPTRRDPTAAARMRRHRARKRNSEPDRNADRNGDRNAAGDDPTLRAEAAE